MAGELAFVHSRRIHAPAARVFGMFSNPTALANWWGPEGFASTFEEFEFRDGGSWKFVMHGPDGREFPNASVFREIVPDRRIVIEHLGGLHHFILTITLDANGPNETIVGWRQVFDTAEEHDRYADIIREANEQNLRRLAANVLMPRTTDATPQALAQAAEQAVQQFKAKSPVDVRCPSCQLLLSVRYAEYSDVFAVSCPCFACRREFPGLRDYPPTPFFRGDVVMNGLRYAVGMAPRLKGWGSIALCSFSRSSSLNGTLTYGSGPHISIERSDEEFVQAAVPGHVHVFHREPGGRRLGHIHMVWGYSAVDEGTHERTVETLELRTTVEGKVARFEFRGHAGAASDVREPDTRLGSGPVDFVAWFEVGRSQLPVFAPNEELRARLEAQLF